MQWAPIVSWLLAIAVHVGGFAWLVLDGTRAVVPGAAPMSVVFVELAPAPTAPSPTTTERVESVVEREIEATPAVTPEPERPAPAPISEIPRLEPSTEQTRTVPEAVETDMAPVDGPPSPAPTVAPDQQVAPTAAAASTYSAQASDALAQWRARLLAHLGTHHRYPFRARRLREEGVVQLRFAVDRGGRVVRFAIADSSRHDLLDEEALAMIQRATPVPAPPPELAGDAIEVVVPVTFDLRRR